MKVKSTMKPLTKIRQGLLRGLRYASGDSSSGEAALTGREDRAGERNSGERMLAGGGLRCGRSNSGEVAVVGGDDLSGGCPPAKNVSPEKRAKTAKNVRPTHYTARQLSDILEGTFCRKRKEALPLKKEQRNSTWLPVIVWMLVIFLLSAQPADQSIILSGSVTRFFADALNQLSAFIEYFTRAQGTIVFMVGILVLIYLLETQEDEPRLFGIKKRWIIVGTAVFLVAAIGLFLFVDFVQNTSFAYAGRLMRKSAHFIAYLILGFLVSHALRNESVASPTSVWRRRGISLLLCVAYAISDEFHQVFVPGRGPLLKDVLIDGAGATLGILIYVGARELWVRRKTKSLKTLDR